MNNFWHYRKSILGPTYDFLKSSRWDCPYIIRLGFNGCCFVYDTRKYSNMKTIDFHFHGYSRVSSHLNTEAAKSKVRRLMIQEEISP